MFDHCEEYRTPAVVSSYEEIATWDRPTYTEYRGDHTAEVSVPKEFAVQAYNLERAGYAIHWQSVFENMDQFDWAYSEKMSPEAAAELILKHALQA